MHHQPLQPAGPLDGLRVLELGHIVAGPSAGLLLADLGADVIKIEPPQTGDAARNMPNQGSTFYAFNRNKRSLALNLKAPEGREIFARLVRTADVVIDNFAPGTLERLGIDYEWACQLNPRIIYCSVKGFLPGPDADRPFLDELAQMAGGLAYMTGPPGQPLRAGASIVDIGASTFGVLGILAALYRRQFTGRGEQVHSGLFETTVFWVANYVAIAQLTGQVPPPMPARKMGSQMGWAIYDLFRTRDQRQVFIAITSNQHWERFCSAFGLEDLRTDPTLGNNRQRVAQRPRLLQRIGDVVQARTFDEVCQTLAQARVPYAPVNTPADLIADPHLQGGGHLLAIDVPGHAGLRVPAIPVTLGSGNRRVDRHPPRLGEHTREVLQELGYSDARIAELEAHGVVRHDGGMLLVDETPR